MREDELQNTGDNMKTDFITACPYCFAENPNAPHSFLAYDPGRPDVVICEKKHGEIPITDEKLKAPELRFHFSHYITPKGEIGYA